MAGAAKEALGVAQIKVVADRGYYSHEQMRQCAEQGIENLSLTGFNEPGYSAYPANFTPAFCTSR